MWHSPYPGENGENVSPQSFSLEVIRSSELKYFGRQFDKWLCLSSSPGGQAEITP